MVARAAQIDTKATRVTSTRVAIWDWTSQPTTNAASLMANWLTRLKGGWVRQEGTA
jgi:hypothetical protein